MPSADGDAISRPRLDCWTFSLPVSRSCYRSCARTLTRPLRPLQTTSTPSTRIYIKDKAFGLRIRPRDRNGDANRLVDHGKARYQRSRSEFYTPVFPFLVQDACDPRDSRTRTRKGDVSGGARLEQSHGRATRGGSSPPSARRHHSARDFRTKSAQRLSSGIEWLPGPLSRILHPGHGLEILEPSQTETPPATAG
jgi:hypothetical protein